ncbi:MAG: hypothetical protein KIS92_06370 [Planctomycetota bacterium]|nr:hypothetical protein [Planctomycetota bacterium]
MPNTNARMLLSLAAAACCAFHFAARAQDEKTFALPPERCVEWKPGVPGGIPKYPVFASAMDAPYNAKGDGQADDTAAIQAALDACPAGQAVLLPAGTYRLTAMLSITKGIVLRGEGPEKTRLINEATAKHVIGICNYDNEIATKIVSGATKGSTSITVDDAGRLKPGDLLLIDQLNDPDFVDINGAGGACTWAGREKGQRAMGQLVQLSAKDGNKLTLSRPIYMNLKAELQPNAVRTSDKIIVKAGVEDLYLESTRKHADSSSTIKLWNAIHCWVRNIEACKANFGGHVTLQRCLGCEVRDSYFHHAHTYGKGSGYGVWVFAQSADTLVENNVCYHLNSGVMLECAGAGNVVAYNYLRRFWGSDFPDTDWAHGGLTTHGAHAFMNLFEGNDSDMFGGDYYWGSASHNTLFRNAFNMDVKTMDGRPMLAILGCRIDAKNYYMNAVGNVLGSDGAKGQVEPAKIENYNQPIVWRLGYKAPSSAGVTEDPKVGQTVLRHGNFDYFARQTQWDPAHAAHKLPASLYLREKPAFFGERAWPAIGSDLTPMVNALPAAERFKKIPAATLAAQDQLYLGQFLLRANEKQRALPVLQQVAEKFPGTEYAAKAKQELDQAK